MMGPGSSVWWLDSVMVKVFSSLDNSVYMRHDLSPAELLQVGRSGFAEDCANSNCAH